MVEEQPRIFTILSENDAKFSRKFLDGVIGVSFNENYVAFSIDVKTVFVYPTKEFWTDIIEIFQDPEILKLISKPIPALRTFIGDEVFNNFQHISQYMTNNGDNRSIPEMKREIMEQTQVLDIKQRAALIALIIMKYKINSDIVKSNSNKSIKKSLFNKKRDCYLLYLTAFNDILITNGPLSFVKLTNMVKSYPYLCRIALNPSMALDGLIKVGALSINQDTTIVSIPDNLNYNK